MPERNQQPRRVSQNNEQLELKQIFDSNHIRKYIILTGVLAVALIIITIILFITNRGDNYADETQPANKIAVSVTVDGVTHTVYTSDATVADVIAMVGFETDEYDEINYDSERKVASGMKIVVVNVEHVQHTDTVAIPYTTEYSSTLEIPRGQQRVTVEGKDGVSERSYDVIYRDGELFESVLLEEVTVSQPRNEIIELGSGGTVEYNGSEITFSYLKTVQVSVYAEGTADADGVLSAVGEMKADLSVYPIGTRILVTGTVNADGIYTVCTSNPDGDDGICALCLPWTVAQIADFGTVDAEIFVLE